MNNKITRSILILVLSFLLPLTFGIIVGGVFVIQKHPTVLLFGVILAILCTILTKVTKRYSLLKQ